MITKSNREFLDVLKSETYKNDTYVSNAIDYLLENSTSENANYSILTASTVIDGWNEKNSTKPRPEIIICCLLREEIEFMPTMDIISSFGYETFSILEKLKDVPPESELEDMQLYFEKNPHDIAPIYLAMAVQNLRICEESSQDKNNLVPIIQSSINIGMVAKNERNENLNKAFDSLSQHFIRHFNVQNNLDDFIEAENFITMPKKVELHNSNKKIDLIEYDIKFINSIKKNTKHGNGFIFPN